MQQEFHASYKKFARIYTIYPLFFYLFIGAGDIPIEESIKSTATGSIIAIALSHIFFIKFVKKNWILTLYNDEIETFSTLGEKRVAHYSELNPPMKINIFIIEVAIFSHKNNEKKFTIITDYVENYEECVEFVEKKIKEVGYV